MKVISNHYKLHLTREQMRQTVFEYPEVNYNQARGHSVVRFF
ncbi:hypothetical protein VCHA50P416_20255 [Vibrio chagasii]|nr:hypothetical protein VCHA42P256_20281 [Vibrio chagasii]CAH7170496.1 hypothetical protein VCHA43P272_20254 [Vibrio chagasii]CAH7363387.1 hypothetical protein VCHA50P416_20255 [Vibrio chagasii]